MGTLALKSSHKSVRNYYAALAQFATLGVKHETALRGAFQGLLETCARPRRWAVVPEWEIRRHNQHPLRVDGALIDEFKIPHGFWEAKDSQDDLAKEARKKFDLGHLLLAGLSLPAGLCYSPHYDAGPIHRQVEQSGVDRARRRAATFPRPLRTGRPPQTGRS